MVNLRVTRARAARAAAAETGLAGDPQINSTPTTIPGTDPPVARTRIKIKVPGSVKAKTKAGAKVDHRLKLCPDDGHDPDVEPQITSTITRKVKLVTQQDVVDKPSPVEDFPMRGWTIKLFMVDEQGREHPADCFNKVTYNLHPSFEQPVQSFTNPPFACSNEGWGEFEMTIDCYYTEKTKLTLQHDLNFQQNKYEVVLPVSFKNPSQALQEKLRELGPLPTDDDMRPKKKGLASKKTASQKYDFEKIADALEKLEEDDLLKIIQMINDHKTPDTYIKSDIEDTILEAGEFSIDLYTMPDILTKTLWDHLSKKGLIV